MNDICVFYDFLRCYTVSLSGLKKKKKKDYVIAKI